jgi:hypothetical protein
VTAASIVAAELTLVRSKRAGTAQMDSAQSSVDEPTGADPRLSPIKQIEAGPLDIGYYETGPSDGPPVLLRHGFIEDQPRSACRLRLGRASRLSRCGPLAGAVHPGFGAVIGSKGFNRTVDRSYAGTQARCKEETVLTVYHRPKIVE